MTICNAVVLDEHGSIDVLQLREIDVPPPGPGEVRVRIRAVALNHLDIWVRRGGPAFKLDYPHRLGSDIVRVVDALRPGAKAVAGARVVVQPGLSCGVCMQCLCGHDNLCSKYKILGENAQGGYAEYIVVPEVNLAAYPERLDFVHAAAAILPFMTAWQMIVHKARLAPPETRPRPRPGPGGGA